MGAFTKTLVIVPSYKPDENLLKLLKCITNQTNYGIIVVNNGSGVRYQSVFHTAEKYATVITYDKRHGKGFAIKRALRYIRENEVEDTVILTINMDGQHTLSDIKDVANTARKNPEALVFGSCRFDTSYKKNSLYGLIKNNLYGSSIHTGLQSISCDMISYLIESINEKDNYETDQRKKWIKDKKVVIEVPVGIIPFKKVD